VFNTTARVSKSEDVSLLAVDIKWSVRSFGVCGCSTNGGVETKVVSTWFLVVARTELDRNVLVSMDGVNAQQQATHIHRRRSNIIIVMLLLLLL
jgi:hypothetical protein